MPQSAKADSYTDDAKNAAVMFVRFPAELFDCIEKVAVEYDSTMSNTLRTLLYVALKNNFTPLLDYIPCVQRSDFRQYTINLKRSQRPKTVRFYFKTSKSLAAKIKSISEKYSTSASQSVRMLVSIALQYNYTEKLKFTRASPLSGGETEARMQSPVIFLDVI